ncbi:MAG: sigma-70 family RNA polymerase sigma factor [Elusimicrobiota bacterium]
MSMQNESVRLIGIARQGDPAALNAVFRHYQHRALGFVRSRLPHKLKGFAESQDILQEGFLKAFKNIGRFDVTRHRGKFFTWFAQVLLNVIHDRGDYHGALKRRWPTRERKRSRILGEDEGSFEGASLPGKDPTPSARMLSIEEAKRLTAALKRLSKPYKDVLVLRESKGLEFPEIARRLGRSYNATRMLHSRAKTHLLELMRD